MPVSYPPGPEVSTLGKYQLIANLGQGGMAEVYLAIAHGPVGFNKLTVIKRLRPNLAEEPEFLAMFLDEARLAARLNHPNVVQTNEVAEVDGLYYIAMEYLDGQPLNRILNRAAKQPVMPRLLLLRVVADALAGLHHAHELADYDGSPIGVVHRDASPHNIFVTYDGQTKVVDFGIAKAATRSAETRGGVLKGKIAYMAPEQARSDDVDRRADIYAMGLVMWEALTGQRLRKGSDLEMLDRIAQSDLPLLSSAYPDCPPALERIFRRATAYAKVDRYATANEMRQDILDYLDSTRARVTSEEVGRLVTHMFEGKRAEMKAIIERQLAGLRRASLEDVGIRVVDARRVTTDSLELPRASVPSGPMSASGATPTASIARVTPSGAPIEVAGPQSTTATIAGRSGRLRMPLFIGLAGLGAALTVFALRRTAEISPGAAATAPVIASAAASPSATSQPTQAPSPATIEVHISAKPDGARMFLDDIALGTNPFVGRFRRDDKPHTVRVEAEGHTSVLRPISFTADQTVDVSLERAEPAKDKPAALPPSEPTVRPNRPKKALEEGDPWKE